MEQSPSLCSLPCSIGRDRLAVPRARRHSRSTRTDPARHRRLDLALAGHHSLHYSAASATPYLRTHPLPPHARPLRFLLRWSPLLHLSGVRQALRPSRNLERHLQAPFHHRGLSGLLAPGSAGNHFHRCLDSPSRRPPLADFASRDLYQRGLWRDSLLLAGQIGDNPSSPVWRSRGLLANLAP